MRRVVGAVLMLMSLLCGCRQEAFDHQPVVRNERPNALQVDEATAGTGWTRHAVEGTVSTTEGDDDAAEPAVTMGLLERGRARFDIACAPCHGRTGYGDGMVVQRGFPAPPSFHQARLRAAPRAYFVTIMRSGYGRMASYAERVQTADRHAIAAYVKALQLSQDAPLDMLDVDERARVAADVWTWRRAP